MNLDYDKINVGDELPSIDKGELTHNQIVRYAGASGDFNPLHNDVEYAKSVGLDGNIAHGMLIMGMAGQVVSSWAGILAVKNFKIAFKDMTKPGEKLIGKGKVKKKKEVDGKKQITVAVSIENSEGTVKVAGDAVIEF